MEAVECECKYGCPYRTAVINYTSGKEQNNAKDHNLKIFYCHHRKQVIFIEMVLMITVKVINNNQ